MLATRMLAVTSAIPLTIGNSDYGSATGSTSINVASMDIGAAPTGTQRRFVYMAACQVTGSTLATQSAATIGGQSASLVAGPYSISNMRIAIYRAEVSSGTTATGHVTLSNSNGFTSLQTIAVYSGPNGITTGSGNADFNENDFISLSLSCGAGGAILAYKQDTNGGVMTWNTLTELHDADVSTSDYASAAAEAFSAAQSSLSITGSVSGSPSTAVACGIGLSPT